jgi:nitrite reductase (NADH) small subunit
MDWHDIASLDDIPRLGARPISTCDGPVAIFRTADDEVYAIRNECPHRKGPLSDGIVHGHFVTCPLHNWVIDLRSGDAVKPDEGCVETIPVRVVAGRIHLALTRALSVVHG